MNQNQELISPRLLYHLDALTSQRDAQVLKKSVMEALIAFVRVESVKLYEISNNGSDYFVCLTSNYEQDGSYDEIPESDSKFEKLSEYPLFAEVLRTATQLTNIPVGGGKLCCCIPILVNDKPVSIFELLRTAAFERAELDVFNGIIAVFRNYLSLLEDSQRDALTNLYNRKTFDHGFSLLIEEISHSSDSDRRVESLACGHWLAVIDIDHFKRINDQFGHLYGDEVLILMANLMRNSFRRYDRLYRFGGEEFIVLLRNVRLDGALEKLEQFRAKMEKYDFPQVGRVTISVGFAAVTVADSPSQIIGHADEALYYAKEHGRNQVQHYEALVQRGIIGQKLVNSDVELF